MKRKKKGKKGDEMKTFWAAPALAIASETPRIALAPSLAFIESDVVKLKNEKN